MKLTYTPGEGDVQTFDLDPEALTIQEQMLVGYHGGGIDLARAVDGHPLALRVALYIALRRLHPSLLWIDCNPQPGEVAASNVVGEVGPETFVPADSGTVTSSRKAKK